MPAIGTLLGKVLVNLGASLLTEKLLKKLVIFALENVVKRTKTDIDDKLLQMAKEEWK